MAPITLSAQDFHAVLEAAGLKPETTSSGSSGVAASDRPSSESAAPNGARKLEPRDPELRCPEREGSDNSGPRAPKHAPASSARDPELAVVGDPVPPESVPVAIPDPFDDADALEELEAEVVQLSAHIEAATYRLLVLIRAFDRRRGWELGGHRSCAHWLHYVTGLDLGAAREKVRAARALEHLPKTSEAMARGQLSFSKVRALTRVATPECEEELLEVARDSTTASLERFVREWRTVSRGDEIEWERMRYESRALSVFPDDDGMYVIKGRLPAEVGALVMRAIEAASDAMFSREARGRPRPPSAGPTPWGSWPSAPWPRASGEGGERRRRGTGLREPEPRTRIGTKTGLRMPGPRARRLPNTFQLKRLSAAQVVCRVPGPSTFQLKRL